ncbi:hypothetical protein Ddc_07699 [Ditylenchus destructor]|nr:hypothetical protein Ddc_07699 [Ditylenchus destructor]
MSSSVQSNDSGGEEKDVPETPSLRPRRTRVNYDERKMWPKIQEVQRSQFSGKLPNKNGARRNSTSGNVSVGDPVKNQFKQNYSTLNLTTNKLVNKRFQPNSGFHQTANKNAVVSISPTLTSVYQNLLASSAHNNVDDIAYENDASKALEELKKTFNTTPYGRRVDSRGTAGSSKSLDNFDKTLEMVLKKVAKSTSSYKTASVATMPSTSTATGKYGSASVACKDTEKQFSTIFDALSNGTDHEFLPPRLLFRPPDKQPERHVLLRTSAQVMPLGKALFYDTSGSKYSSPFAREVIVFFYRSGRWNKRETVWIPYGKGASDGDVAYTCISCFKYAACLKHHFKRPTRKIPIVIARMDKFLDDPDFPSIPHFCDSVAEYTEYMYLGDDISEEDCYKKMNLLETKLNVYCGEQLVLGHPLSLKIVREKAFLYCAQYGIPKSFITNELLENIILSAGSIRHERADPIMDMDSISGLPQENRMFAECDEEEESGMEIGNPNDCLMNMISAALSKQQQEENECDRQSNSSRSSSVCIIEPETKEESVLPKIYVSDDIEITATVTANSNTDASEPLIRYNTTLLDGPSSIVKESDNGTGTPAEVQSISSDTEYDPASLRTSRSRSESKSKDYMLPSHEPPRKEFYSSVQDTYTKTNHSEISDSLELIRNEIAARDMSLMPMFNTFYARMIKMMFTTESEKNLSESRKRKASNSELR